MRRKLVVGNWKMNPPTIREARDLAASIVAALPGGRADGGVEVGVAPPTIALPTVLDEAGALRVFAQDVHWAEAGAYTGKTSAPMLAGLGGRLYGSIVGHSEVRRDQGDDDARVAKKAAAALRQGLRVIYCIGETLAQREAGETDAVIGRQIRDGVATIDRGLLLRGGEAWSFIAYEPVWAIGTGVVATPAQASAAILAVRRELTRAGLPGDSTTVLYGGSVSAVNCADCAGAEGVDGALVGGASLKAEEFAKIVAAFR